MNYIIHIHYRFGQIMETKTYTEMADTYKIFWLEFMEKESEIKMLILNRNQDDHKKATNITDSIINKLGLTNKVGVMFGVDIRNGMILAERKEYIELVLTPLFQRKNKETVVNLYKASANILPKYWSVIKYKFWQPSNIETINVNYKDDANIVEVTKSDFEYHPIIDNTNSKLNIILFVNDDKAKFIIKKEIYEFNHTKREIWIPKDYGIYAILDSAIGEYHLLNTLDKMEIYLKSEESEITERYPIENITNVIHMISNNPLSTINTCSRCYYSNKHTILKVCSKCKNSYYCDSICQKAHSKMHKLTCK